MKPSRTALAFLLWALACVAAAAPTALAWDDLRPPAREQHDPFAALAPAQFDALSELALGQMLEARGRALSSEALARRERLTAQLARDGLDAAALLRERERLMAQRRAQAETPVAAWDGRAVQLKGFLVAASADGQALSDWLLLPAPGACSHAQQPPMNQVVRLRAPALQGRTIAKDQPVVITGTLRVQPLEQNLWLADGPASVRSAYALEDVSVSPN